MNLKNSIRRLSHMINHMKTNIHWSFLNLKEINIFNCSCHIRDTIQNEEEKFSFYYYPKRCISYYVLNEKKVFLITIKDECKFRVRMKMLTEDKIRDGIEWKHTSKLKKLKRFVKSIIFQQWFLFIEDLLYVFQLQVFIIIKC